MTTATTRSRTRKARATAQALIPRGQHLIDQGADMLMLNARMAETPLPVFWAPGELDARLKLAVPADADWDDHYRRVFEDPSWWDWNWYRDALLADERAAAVPVVTVTVAHEGLPEDADLDAKVGALMALYAEQDGPLDDSGPAGDPVAAPPAAAPQEPAGPGSPDDDPALD